MTQPVRPAAFHVMAKPAGSACNLSCEYCFYLEKASLYRGSRLRMNDKVLEEYLRQYLQAQDAVPVTIAWQGGEPTLMGLEFFERAVALVEKHRLPGMAIEHTIQTNGTLLDDRWCEFFRSNGFLVGLSLDGSHEHHDAFRRDRSGKPTFDRVMKGLELLNKHEVDVNILCSVHAANATSPLEVYRFFRDEIGARWLQFIPIVERIKGDGDAVTGRSVLPERWGGFLAAIFDEWVRHDVGDVYVNIFEASLAAWMGLPATLCIFDETCGHAVALEHNGDLYSCDHFVEPGRLLGNVMKTPLPALVDSADQVRFGQSKRDSLPAVCVRCEVGFACNGECPKNRFIRAPDGEPGLNYLCDGYRRFFRHVDLPMRAMVQLHAEGRPPSEVMEAVSAWDAAFREACARAGRNDPCPCGSGRKFKRCHGAG